MFVKNFLSGCFEALLKEKMRKKDTPSGGPICNPYTPTLVLWRWPSCNNMPHGPMSDFCRSCTRGNAGKSERTHWVKYSSSHVERSRATRLAHYILMLYRKTSCEESWPIGATSVMGFKLARGWCTTQQLKQALKWTQDDRNPDFQDFLENRYLLHKWTP